MREGAGDLFDRRELSMPAFRAIVTNRPEDVATELAGQYGIAPDQVLASPDFLIGSEDEIVAQLQERRERFASNLVRRRLREIVPPGQL